MIIIDGIYDKDMLVSVADRPKIVTPDFEFESDYVDGRNGSVNRLKYIKDVEQTVTFNILENFNIKDQLRQIKAWLLNAKRFQFSDDFVFRKVKRVQIGDIANDIAEYGSFDATFVCDPFEYLAADDPITINNQVGLVNLGTYFSLPKIEIMGKGGGTIKIGDQVISLDLPVDHAILDSEIQEIYKDDQNLGLSMTGDFPRLKPGINQVAVTGVGPIKVWQRGRFL